VSTLLNSVGTLPILAAQREIWSAERILRGVNTVFQVGEYIDVPGAIDGEIFEAALRCVIAEIDTVRVSFSRENGSVVQEVGPVPAQVLTQVDLSHAPDPEAAAEMWMRHELATPRDLSSGRLFNFALIRLDSTRYRWYQNYHHIVMDAFGSHLVSRRVCEVYTALAAGGDPSPCPFGSLRELTEEEAIYRASGDEARDRGFWHAELADHPGPSPLLSRTAGTPAGFFTATQWLTEQQFGTLRKAARAAKVPWSAVAMAAAALHVRRSTGEDDVTLAFPVTARASHAARRTPANLANVLPLRLRMRPGMTVAGLLTYVSGRMQEVVDHQRYRGVSLQQELGTADAWALGPTINVMSHGYDLDLGGTRATMRNLASGLVGNLLFAVWDRQDRCGLQIDVNGRNDVWTHDDVVAQRDEFTTLLAALAAATPADLVDDLAPAAVVEADYRTLPDLFRARAAAAPCAPALTDAGRTWSYRELDEWSDRLAQALRGFGAGPEDLVALALPRSVELVAAIIAIQKAGAAYLPVDPAYPQARIDYMLADAAPKLLVTSASTAVDAGSVERLLIEDVAAGDSGPVAVAVEPDGAAYVIYTSGSTGRPKGVVVTHRNVVRLFESCRSFLDAGPDDVWTLFHSTSFDFSVWEIWGALLHGGRVVVVPQDVSRSPRAFRALLADEGVTVLSQTPSAFHQLDDADDETRAPLALRTVVFGGEALHPRRLDGWRRRHPQGPALVNMYGITETTVHVTREILGAVDDVPSPIGRPLADLRVHVLDETLRRVPDGVTGEMYVAGPGLARGYLGRRALTAERFVADPFGVPGERMYRTGDLARRHASGRLEYMGRTDDQVKVRGFRIELGEIEAELATCPGVASAAVVVTEDRQDDRRLAAFIVAERGAEPQEGELRAAVRERLPAHMVPARVIRIDALPMTSNGKLDRAALGGVVPNTPADDALAAPASRLDVMLALFAAVLNEPEVGPHDDFFDLGGHSVLATQLVNRARVAFSPEVEPEMLYEDPTPAGLLAQIDAHVATAVPGPAESEASHAQRRLWFVQQMTPQSAAYNIPLVLRIDGPLDTAALAAALGDIAARHECLRTIFPAVGGRPVQRVLGPTTPHLAPRTVLAAELEPTLRAAAGRPFDLTAEPPLRTELFRTTPDAHVLLLTLHHIGADGLSIAPLARDLAQAYAARIEGQTPGFEPLPATYQEIARRQEERLAGRAARHLDHWRTQLKDLPEELDLPTDRSRPAVAPHTGDFLEVDLDADLHTALLALSRACGVSLFMLLQAGLAALLSRLGAGHDIPLGSPVAGRDQPSHERVVGLFVNMIVIRTDVSGRPTFRQLLKRVRETALRAYAHQEMPFEHLVDAIAPERSLARHPLFQVVLSLQDTPPAGDFGLPGLAVTTEMGHSGSAKFDLSFSLHERFGPDGSPAGIGGLLEYADSLFDADTVRDLFARFARLLAAAVDDPGRPVDELGLLTPAEQDLLLLATVDDRPDGTLPARFEQQARRTPNNVAVTTDDVELTYAELDARANRWAHGLIRAGVRSGDAVAVVVPRSADLVVALLAAAKVGAAYVPIDARYPARQIAAMLADTSPKAVLMSRSADTSWLEANVARLVVDDADGAPDDTRPPTDVDRGVVHPLAGAYVMYTSGSSGRPKGIVTTHRDVVALATDPHFGNGVTDVVLVHSPAAFDASTFEIWAPLLHGGRLVVAPSVDLDVEVYTALIERHRPTALWLTAAVFAVVAEFRPGCFTGVRQVWAGGEELPADKVARVLIACPGTAVVNGYGPTETTTFATSHTVRDVAEIEAGMPIGRPLAGMRAYVLDAHLQPVPPGVTGELHVAGTGVARGYIERSALTAERFVADPHGPAGDRMYRTGDLARWTRDGVLEYRGRVDRQIKLHGFRIEPGHIEAVLCMHPDVAQAVVDVRREGVRTRMVAYVVPAGERRPAPAALRDFALGLLPEYMVPPVLAVVGAVPLTANGKVDRAALSATGSPDLGRHTPSGPSEQVLCDLIAATLGLAGVGADDDFFTLGGDSISSMRLVSAAREEGLTITVRDVFENRTAARLGAVATTATSDYGVVDEGTGLVPETPILSWLREFGTPIRRFAQSMLLAVPAGLDLDALTVAVGALVDTHDALRARLVDADDGWGLQIPPPGSGPADGLVRQVDVQGLAADAVTDVARAELDLASLRLHPADGRMLQVVHLDAGSAVAGRVLLVFHHFAVDGVSWRILVPDLVSAYTQALTGQKPLLPGVPTSLRRWARELSAQATSPARLAELPFWMDVLTSAPMLTDEPADPRRDRLADAVEVVGQLPAEVAGPLLRSAPSAFHCGVQELLVTALGLAVSSWSREHRPDSAIEGVLVDVEGHGREDVVPRADLSRTLGWFTAVRPVRVDPGPVAAVELASGGPRVGVAVKRVKEQLGAAADHGLGFGLLRYRTPGCREVLARLETPPIGFNYLGRFPAPGAPVADTPGWTMAPELVMTTTAEPEHPMAHGLELHVIVFDADDGPRLTATWTGASRLWRREDLADLGARWSAALDGIVAHALYPGAGGHSPSDFPLAGVSQADIDDIEAAW
jgi:amino acid adenylation domain-containing protein/non-ribosomal peptide synthase protein (TIGR01720 family)